MNSMVGLFYGTIIVMTTIAIIILSFAVFTEPFMAVNEALRDAANNSDNPNVSQDVTRVTEKTEQNWYIWPVIFIGGMIVWYILWGQKWIYERY